jgi:DNA-binding transcriptional regulator YhcF (GntR family)
MHIHPQDPLPVHAQLGAQLQSRIELGIWKPGKQLPSVRALAAALRINYHTVRAAYHILERDGYVVTEPGQGTFVVAHPSRLSEEQAAQLLHIIDEATFQSRTCGIPPEIFLRATSLRIQQLPAGRAKSRLLFVECNQPDVDYHSKTLEQRMGLAVEKRLLSEVAQSHPSFFAQFGAIATPLFHRAELQQIVGAAYTVLGLLITPSHTEVLTPLADLPAQTSVGLICATHEGAQGMEQMLLGMGITHLHFLLAGLDEPWRLASLFTSASRVYVSRLGLSLRHDPWPEPGILHRYETTIDDAALHVLQMHLMQSCSTP